VSQFFGIVRVSPVVRIRAVGISVISSFPLSELTSRCSSGTLFEINDV
jgi:hypothetical protein